MLVKANKTRGVIDILHEGVPSFFESLEYRELDEEDAGVIGLVCAAFAKYWSRLACAVQPEESKEFQECANVVELLSSSNDADILNYVVTEVLENLDAGQVATGAIRAHMGEKTRDLFLKWLS